MMMPDALVIRDDAAPLPELVVDSPVSGEFHSPMDRDVQVTGRVISFTPDGILTINGSQVLIGANGEFKRTCSADSRYVARRRTLPGGRVEVC